MLVNITYFYDERGGSDAIANYFISAVLFCYSSSRELFDLKKYFAMVLSRVCMTKRAKYLNIETTE
jgi:hypothetical protein